MEWNNCRGDSKSHITFSSFAARPFVYEEVAIYLFIQYFQFTLLV